MNLTEGENKIISAREVGKAICDLTDKEASLVSTGIIFKISAITGCQLPTHEAHINALEDELLKFLKEFNGYEKYTVEEILTAFRMNAAFQLDEKVEDYGKIFNVEYVGKVLKQYSKKRFNLEYKLRDAYHKQEEDKRLANASQKRRERVQSQYAKFLNSEDLDLADCYMQLVEDGGFHKGKFHERYYDVCLNNVLKKNEIKSLGQLLNYDKLKYQIEAKFDAEKKAVVSYFEAIRDMNKQDKVYDDAWKLIQKGFHIEDKKEEIEPEW